MSLLQQPVQAKLSKLIGAEVRFDHLSISLLGGSIEARGVTVAGDDPGQPVLTIRRVRAEISIPRALKKEFVIKSLTIEGPVLSVVKRSDGRTNLPRPIKPAPDEGDDGAAAAPTASSASRAKTVDESADESAGGAWKLEAQRVLLVDGAVRYHADAPAGGEPLDLAAEGLLAELKSAGGGFDFTCIVESLGRRGSLPADLGQVKCAGRAEGVEDLSQILKARVMATLDAGGLLKANITVPTLKPIEATVSATGGADLAKLLAFVPENIAKRVPLMPVGNVEFEANVTYAGGKLAVSEMTVRARGIDIKL